MSSMNSHCFENVAGIRRLILVVFSPGALLLLGCTDRLEPQRSATPASIVAPDHVAKDESPVVSLTPKAAAMIKKLIAEEQKTTKVYLRVYVVPGGCRGEFAHRLDLEQRVSPDDQVIDTDGVSIVFSKRQAEMLQGTRIDFVQNNETQGFKTDTPNLKGAAAERWFAVLEKERH